MAERHLPASDHSGYPPNVESDFSEFSYGYAAIREAEETLSTIYTAAGAPKLPTLIEEKTLGYDARLSFVDYVLFLQFKRSQYVSRRHPGSPTWAAVGGKHYRYSIDTSGHQFQALLELEARLERAPIATHVYYAAPVFHSQRDFDRAYTNGAVLENSSLIAPSEFPSMDGVHHLVATTPGSAVVLSEPRPVASERWATVESRVRATAARAAARAPRPQMRLGELEQAVRASVARLDRNIEIAPDTSVFASLHRAAAILGCGLALTTLDPFGA